MHGLVIISGSFSEVSEADKMIEDIVHHSMNFGVDRAAKKFCQAPSNFEPQLSYILDLC